MRSAWMAEVARKEYEYTKVRRLELKGLLRRANMIPMATLTVGDYRTLTEIDPKWADYGYARNENRYWTAHVWLSRLLKEREL